MFAVVRTGGKQYLVTPPAKLKIEKLAVDEGQEVTFEEVLLLVDGSKVSVGQPTIQGAKVIGKVLRQGRAKKVIVFKYKPKKRYKKKRGHRQPFSEIEIKEIRDTSAGS